MIRILISALGMLALASCATNAIPPDYKGPFATIQESAERVDSGKAKMFYLSRIGERYIRENSGSRSFVASYGKGNNLTIINTPYKIPAQPHVFTIVGSHVWAMDGRALIEDDLRVSGEVKFSPEPGRTYLVGGSLSNSKSLVWIKDSETGKVIAEFVNDKP